MKKVLSFFLLAIGVGIYILSCSSVKNTTTNQLPSYSPESKALHDSIAYMDSVFFEAYNNCRLDKYEGLISDDVEFYHDRGGLMTSKKDLVQATKNNICGKVARELLAGSIEVYPIPNYGAVQMGFHRFHNLREKSTSRFAKFVHTWHKENGQWKLARVISLH